MLYLYYGAEKVPASLGYPSFDELLGAIPEIKQKLQTETEIHFSANHCDGSYARKWQGCDLLYFDLDNPKGEIKEIRKILVDTTGINEEFWNVHSSGNGYHFFVRINKIENLFEFQILQGKYRKVIEVLNKSHTGLWDMVFDNARTMRLPFTMNTKNGNNTFSNILYKGEGVVSNPLGEYESAGVQKDKKLEVLPPSSPPTLSRKDTTVVTLEPAPSNDFYSWHGGKPDTEEVLNSCEFLKFAKNNPTEVREPEWYAMISVVSRLEDGPNLVHSMSESHPGYSMRETDNKINQSLAKSGPYKCNSINARWGKCQTCPHFGKITSPIQLKSKQHIATRDQGFQSKVETSSGALRFSPCHDDMVKFFEHELNVKYLPKSKDFYKYDNGKYTLLNDVQVKGVIRTSYKPAVETKVTNETYKRLEETESIHVNKELDDYPMLLNCQNGVLNLATGELMDHSPDFLFTTKIAVNYDSNAQAPEFRKWLSFIMENDEEKVQTVIDYMAYCIAGSEEFNEKILILNGKGANGKSVLVKIIQMLLGEYFAFAKTKSFSGFGKEIIMGKRLICFEELPANTEKDFWEEIKDLSSGGTAVIDRKFKPVMNYKSKAKFIFICNTMPYGSDANHGFFRRFIIANFPKQFTEDEIVNHFEKNFVNELPGILNMLIERIKVLHASYFKLKVAASMQIALENYKQEKDVVYDYYINALTDEGKAPRPTYYLQKEGCRVKLRELYKNHFEVWLKDGGYPNMNVGMFKRRLKEIAGDSLKTTDGVEVLVGKVPTQ